MGALLVPRATGRTGREVVRLAHAAGREVRGHGRRPPSGVDRVLVGPFEDAELAEAVGAAAVALACLASTAGEPVCSRATRAVMAAARGRPLRCLVVSGAGVRLAAESKPAILRAFASVVRLREERMMRDRDAGLALLAGSGLRWTALRPPLLRPGALRGRWAFSDPRPRRLLMHRTDLAGAMLEAAGRDHLAGRAPYMS